MDKNKRYILGNEVVLQRFDEDALLVDLNTEKIFQLNATGTRIVELLVADASIKEILAVLKGEYFLDPSEAERDILILLEELLAQNLIIECSSLNHD